jgi:DNA-binding PadR family transcriptional regulator
MQLALDEARTSPPTGSEELAQGSDEFETRLTFSMYLSKPSLGRIRDTIDIDPSWDRIFAALGPLMLDESAEEALGEHIDYWVGVEYWPEVQGPVSEAITTHGSEADSFTYSNYKAEISNEDFHTILVQLVALGLITKSDRKRSVADKSTYWTLTPYGRTRLIQLRAIRREGSSALVSESVQDLTETTKAVDEQQPFSPEAPTQSSGNRKDRSVSDSTYHYGGQMV